MARYGTATVTGNVIRGTGSPLAGTDTLGADGATVTGAQAGALTGGATHVADGGVNAVGSDTTALAGDYGTLVLHADGSYSYTLDNANTTVNALKDGETLTELFSIADARLYAAKEAGRNRVVGRLQPARSEAAPDRPEKRQA